jgi:hypothetical protein
MNDQPDHHITLFKQDGATFVSISAYISDESGALVIEGQDIGEAPRKFFGRDDTEYFTQVDAGDKDALLAALLRTDPAGAATEETIAETLRQPTPAKDELLLSKIHARFAGSAAATVHLAAFMKEHGIPYHSFSWP